MLKEKPCTLDIRFALTNNRDQTMITLAVHYFAIVSPLRGMIIKLFDSSFLDLVYSKSHEDTRYILTLKDVFIVKKKKINKKNKNKKKKQMKLLSSNLAFKAPRR